LINKMFEGRALLIATKHHKERVIAPLLEKVLGVKCFTDSSLDTDILGTFTGEIERKDDPLTTVRNKCLMASKATKCDLIVASEGSFFPHPALPFIHINVEILCLMDYKNNLEIVAHEQSSETNFYGNSINSTEELNEFCEKTRFPSHRLIIRRSKKKFIEIVKGIQSYDELLSYYNYFMNTYDEAYIETDMRAMYNPTRMNVIEKTTKNLIDKINSCCPECDTPGFGVTDTKRGLPCEICQFPTNSILSLVYECMKCSFIKYHKYPNGKNEEDAMYCDMCNP